MNSRPRIAIIGGGLAGMAAAAGFVESGLLERGGQIDLYEAKRRTGGRAGSFEDAESGIEIDYCQHVGMGCCTNLLHWIRWAGIEDCFQRYDTLNFIAPGVLNSAFRPTRWLPPPLNLAPAFQRLRTLTGSERRQVARGIWGLMRMPPDGPKPLTEAPRRPQTMGDWLRRHGQSDAVIGKFWNLVLASALGDHVDAVAIPPARKVFVDGFLGASGASDILVPREPLSELFGKRVPETLINAGVSVHRGVRIRKLDFQDGVFQLYPNHGATIEADAVVAAVPWHALRRLIGEGRLSTSVERLGDIGLFPGSPISGIHLWLDRAITTLPHAVIVDALSQWIFRSPTTSDAASGEHYYQVVISAAHDLRGRDSEEIIARVVEELNRTFPGDTSAKCLRYKIVTDPAAVFSIGPEVEKLRPSAATSQAGFVLAGDWVQTGWPATMEGAVISGYQAAETVLDNLGLSFSLVRPSLKRGLTAWLLIK